MRQTSRKILNLALVSSVAAIALMTVNASAQTANSQSMPSVEIHLEVLNSLSQTVSARGPVIENRYPVKSSDMSSNRMAAPPIERRAAQLPMQSQVIMQQLPGMTQPSRPATIANTVAEPQYILTPPVERASTIPQPAQASQPIKAPQPASADQSFSNMQASATTKSTAPDAGAPQSILSVVMPEKKASVNMQAQREKEEGLFDSIANIFKSDEEPQTLPPAAVKAPTTSAKTAMAAPKEYDIESDNFFDTMNESATGQMQTAPAASNVPVMVSPRDETVAKLIAPEMQVNTNTALAPAASQAPVTALSNEAPKVTNKAASASSKVEVIPGTAPVDDISSSMDSEIDFKPFAETNAKPQEAKSINNPSAEKASAKSNVDDFPKLSDIPETNKADFDFEALPNSAEEWLQEDSKSAVPASGLNTQSSMAKINVLPELPQSTEAPIEKKKLVDPLIAKPIIAEPAKVAEKPANNSPQTSLLKTPVVPAKQPEKQTSKALEAIPTISTKTKLSANSEPKENNLSMPALSSAEESLLKSASNPQKVDMAANGKSDMENALDEIEPVKSDNDILTEDFALLEVPAEPVNTTQVEDPKPAPKPISSTQPVNNAVANPKKESGFLPGITNTFKSMLSKDEKSTNAAATTSDAPKPLPPINATAQVAPMPAALPDFEPSQKAVLPPLTLLGDNAGTLDNKDDLDLGALDAPKLTTKIASPEPIIKKESFEMATLQAEDSVSVKPKPVIGGASALSIEYDKDTTDVPDSQKAALVSLANKAKAANQRVIIVGYAGGEQNESQAARMISLSRGLSLRAFFIDNDIAEDRIIVQPKGIENAGGKADRADISLD